jgi:clan AA aspartic protease
MINGTVNADREAISRLLVRGPDGQEQEIDAVIDTGFNGFLTLPLSIVAAFGLPLLGRGRAILANGSEELFNIHEVTVIWDGEPRVVDTDAADTDALVGMSMLYGYNLQIQAIDGGSVTIETLP